jgi:hypothetical protein
MRKGVERRMGKRKTNARSLGETCGGHGKDAWCKIAKVKLGEEKSRVFWSLFLRKNVSKLRSREEEKKEREESHKRSVFGKGLEEHDGKVVVEVFKEALEKVVKDRDVVLLKEIVEPLWLFETAGSWRGGS